MITLIVLFNLKPGVSAERYEAWARERDLPTVSALASVDGFEVLRATGLMSGEGAPPYRYVEILRVESIAALRSDIGSTPAMAGIAREFREFADAPLFVVTSSILE